MTVQNNYGYNTLESDSCCSETCQEPICCHEEKTQNRVQFFFETHPRTQRCAEGTVDGLVCCCTPICGVLKTGCEILGCFLAIFGCCADTFDL